MGDDELWEFHDVSDSHPLTLRSRKYAYIGVGRTITLMRTDKPVCCEPVFKQEQKQTVCKRRVLLETSKYQPHRGKQECLRRLG